MKVARDILKLTWLLVVGEASATIAGVVTHDHANRPAQVLFLVALALIGVYGELRMHLARRSARKVRNTP